MRQQTVGSTTAVFRSDEPLNQPELLAWTSKPWTLGGDLKVGAGRKSHPFVCSVNFDLEKPRNDRHPLSSVGAKVKASLGDEAMAFRRERLNASVKVRAMLNGNATCTRMTVLLDV
jgi:hypothetical protein